MSETTTTEPATASAPEPTPGPAPAPSKKSAARFITPALAIVAALVIGGVAGVLIGQNTAPTGGPAGMRPGEFVQNGDGPQFQGGPGGFTAGTIQSIDGDTIIVELEDGSTVTVKTSADTTVTQTEEATVGDLAEGDEITVVGETGDDDTVTADSISEGDQALRFGGDFPGGPTTDSNGN